MTSLNDVAVLVFREDATRKEYADAIVDLASVLGLLDGRDPSVLHDYLLSERGQAWMEQHLVAVHLSTLLSTELGEGA